MENIVKIEHGLLDLLKQKPFYKFRVVVEDDSSNEAVFLVERLIFNNKNYYGKRLKQHLEYQYKKFIKEMENDWYFVLVDNDNDYTFDYKEQFVEQYEKSLYLTPANETMKQFLDSDFYIDDYNFTKGVKD